jgi:hypothetical protein
MQNRQHHAFEIAQRDRRATTEAAGEFLGDIEGDGDRPECAVSQPHAVADRFVVVASHEAAKRPEPAVDQHLEIAQLPRSQLPGRPRAGGVPQIRRSRRAHEEIDEDRGVRTDFVAVEHV